MPHPVESERPRIRYLVTGGLGVIGSLFARQLVRDGYEVTIVDDGSDPRHAINAPDHATIHGVKLGHSLGGRLWDCSELLADVDYVIHAAGSTGIPYSEQAPLDDWERNVNGTLCLLEALRKEPRPTVVLSSVEPYHTGSLPLTELTPLSADEPYAASQAAQSLMAQAFARSFELPVVVLRCSNLYGPAACHGPRHGWATWFAIQAALGAPIEIQGDGSQQRDLLYWSDLLPAVQAALAQAEDLQGEIFNIGGGRENLVSVNDAVAYLRTLTELNTIEGAARRFEDSVVYVDNSKVIAALDWAPKVRPPEGLQAIFKWASSHRADLVRAYGA